MAKTLVIQPVTRIEGHAKVTIQLDDGGNVDTARVNVIELRGFERFCIGRPVEDMPRITPRICGVCPWSHHLASAKACDAVFGVVPPPAGRKLRELCNSLAYMEEHILHFYFLAGADFLLGPSADYSVRNVIGILQAAPDVARRVVRVRHMCAHMLEILAGKPIHPQAAVPGGFSKPLAAGERDDLAKMAEEGLELAKFSIAFAKENVFPKYLDVVKSLGVITTGFLGTVSDNGALNLYDGKLRLMKPDGSFEEFPYDRYTEFIAEHIEPWTYLKFPYAKKWGGFSMDEGKTAGIYRTNTLARLNVCDRIDTPLAQAELEEFRQKFGRPAQLTLLYHWARLIELLYNAENAVRLLADPEITSPETRVKVTPRAARGVGCVEAPRGTLIHDYETDADGMLTNVNLIVGTTHNNAPINMSVTQAAKGLIRGGNYDQGILNTVEMSIRAYDPCFSCATHRLDGKLSVKVDIMGGRCRGRRRSRRPRRGRPARPAFPGWPRACTAQGSENVPSSTCAGRPGIDQRADEVEHRAASRHGQRLAHRRDVLERRMIVRREEKDITQLLHGAAQFFGRRGQVDPERGQQVGAAAFRGDAAVAVLHHRHAGAGQHQRHQAGDIESAHVVAARADDVDGLRRPRLQAGIERQGAKNRGKRRDLGRRLPLVGERREKGGFLRVGHLGRGQRQGGVAGLGGVQLLPGGESGGQLGKPGHGAEHFG